MPIKNARYRWKTLKSGEKIRLTFVKNKVVEVKKPGEDAEFVRRVKARYKTSHKK